MTRARTREPRIQNIQTHPRRYVSKAVAAEYLTISVDTLNALIDEGKLGAVQFRLRRKIPLSELARFEQRSQERLP